MKQNQVWWGSNATTDVLPRESRSIHFSSRQRRSLPHSNVLLGEKHAKAPAAYSVVLYLLLSGFFAVPKVSQPVLLRRSDTELQMGGAGPRQLVSQRGLEFTVGIKYETNMSLYICFPLVCSSSCLRAQSPLLRLALPCKPGQG